MGDIIEKLKGPELVSNFQKYFGIETVSVEENNPNNRWIPVEIKSKSESKETINGNLKKDENILKYKVHNKFWLHLFKFGSFLGEELSYAMLFSFLIWSVDSVVGRRVFLVGYFTFYIGQVTRGI